MNRSLAAVMALVVAACQAPEAAPVPPVAPPTQTYDEGVTYGLKLASARIELQRAQGCNPVVRGAATPDELAELEVRCRIYAEAMKLVFDGTDDHLLGEVK